MKITFECPICYKCFDHKIDLCDNCGFDKFLEFPQRFLSDEERENEEQLLLFHIYKYAKAVYSGKIPFEKDVLDTDEAPDEENIQILGASGKFGLSIV